MGRKPANVSLSEQTTAGCQAVNQTSFAAFTSDPVRLRTETAYEAAGSGRARQPVQRPTERLRAEVDAELVQEKAHERSASSRPYPGRSNERTRTIDSSAVGASAGNRKRVYWKSAEVVVPPRHTPLTNGKGRTSLRSCSARTETGRSHSCSRNVRHHRNVNSTSEMTPQTKPLRPMRNLSEVNRLRRTRSSRPWTKTMFL